MRETKERELKLTAPDEFVLDAELGEPIEPRVFTSTYYDTPDHALATVAITLRRRLENGKSLWQLKLPGDGFRRELEVPGGPAGPPGPLQDPLFALVRSRELVPIGTLKTRRSGVRVRENGHDLAEVVLDSVAVMDDGRVDTTFSEIEVELLEGGTEVLDRLGKALRREGAQPSDGRPKVFRALGLAPAEVRGPGAEAHPLLHVAFTLAAQLREILAHDPGVRLGSDPEDVHRMRVAVRRARAVLRTARPILDRSASEALRAELDWLGSALGPVRDLDVLLEHLREQKDSLPPDDAAGVEQLAELLAADRELARAQLIEALESERFLSVLDGLAALAREPLASGRTKPLASLAARRFEKVRKAVASLPSRPSDDQLHRIRIQVKRARYAAELAEATAGKPASRFVKRAKRVQDVIGEHQDAVVAAQRTRELLARASGGAAALAAGRLVERDEDRRRQARDAFPKAWRKLEQSGRLAWR